MLLIAEINPLAELYLAIRKPKVLPHCSSRAAYGPIFDCKFERESSSSSL
jgi:hypothetical protein